VGHHVLLESIAVADCAIDIEGSDLDDLFATAAGAVAELMVDPATVGRAVERRVEIAAPSLDLLLYDWLSELIYLKDSEQLVFPEIHVHVTPGDPCRLSAELRGDLLQPGTTELRADAKAVTLHQFALAPVEQGWRARVVIDL